MGPYHSQKFRLIHDRQKPLVDEILRCHAKRELFKELAESYPTKSRIFYDIINALHSQICLNAWILFCDNKNKDKSSYYLQLAENNFFIKQTTGIEPLNKPLSKKELNKLLLGKAGMEPDEFKNIKENLSIFRNKHLAHREDYFAEEKLGKRLVCTDATPLAKLAYGLGQIIIAICRIEDDGFKINIRYKDEALPFDELISDCKSTFEKDFRASFCLI